MTHITGPGPSKTHRDENFPVASHLIHPRHRGTILAFYRFARAADDVADASSLAESEKLALLDRLEDTLLGKSDADANALPLRAALAERGLSPRHGLDLLTAFRMDVTKRRYRDWDDLMQYCTYSAMPVGRFVLDVHGESRTIWPASDALCAALQIINHLQDCGADYKSLDRVYIPLDVFARHGADVTALAAAKASPTLLNCIREIAERTSAQLEEAKPFSGQIADLRLGLEVAVIHRLATTLRRMLMWRDPLSERVHLTEPGFAGLGLIGVSEGLVRRFVSARPRLSGGSERTDPMPEAAEKQASGSSFYAAMRLMPPGNREAMFAIYSFCRAVDDVADEGGPRDVRLAELARWRADVNALYAGTAAPRVRGLVIPIRDFDLERKDFFAIIDGMEMDARADIRAPDFDTLDLYCDRVASAVGRLCVKVFGLEAADGIALAHHLGRALQLTNILRDLDEDAETGRLYLAREWLDQAGITAREPAAVLQSPNLERACAVAIEHIGRHFEKADAIMERYPRRIVRTPRLMAEAYKAILQKLVMRGWSSPRLPVRIGRPLLMWLVLRHAL